MSSGNTLPFVFRGGVASLMRGTLRFEEGTCPTSLTLVSLLAFPDNVRFSPRCRCRLPVTQPCFRFFGVVMNTRQSPIWIERWPAALSAGSACLGSSEPQKTFGNPAVSKSPGTTRVARSAVTVSWLTGACAWSSPVLAHGRGVSSIYQPRRNARVCRG